MALAYKGIATEFEHVNLLDGEQASAAHLARNPSGLVPCLRIENGGKPVFLNQSVAIIEWLEDTFPQKPLLPKNALERAKVRELVQIVNADTQPVQNLRVMQFHSPDQTERAHWARHWIEVGLQAFETAIQPISGQCCFGDTATMADLFLIPQVYNAGRFNVELSAFPTISRIYAETIRMPFCQETAPDRYSP